MEIIDTASSVESAQILRSFPPNLSGNSTIYIKLDSYQISSAGVQQWRLLAEDGTILKDWTNFSTSPVQVFSGTMLECFDKFAQNRILMGFRRTSLGSELDGNFLQYFFDEEMIAGKTMQNVNTFYTLFSRALAQQQPMGGQQVINAVKNPTVAGANDYCNINIQMFHKDLQYPQGIHELSLRIVSIGDSRSLQIGKFTFNLTHSGTTIGQGDIEAGGIYPLGTISPPMSLDNYVLTFTNPGGFEQFNYANIDTQFSFVCMLGIFSEGVQAGCGIESFRSVGATVSIVFEILSTFTRTYVPPCVPSTNGGLKISMIPVYYGSLSRAEYYTNVHFSTNNNGTFIMKKKMAITGQTKSEDMQWDGNANGNKSNLISLNDINRLIQGQVGLYLSFYCMEDGYARAFTEAVGYYENTVLKIMIQEAIANPGIPSVTLLNIERSKTVSYSGILAQIKLTVVYNPPTILIIDPSDQPQRQEKAIEEGKSILDGLRFLVTDQEAARLYTILGSINAASDKSLTKVEFGKRYANYYAEQGVKVSEEEVNNLYDQMRELGREEKRDVSGMKRLAYDKVRGALPDYAFKKGRIGAWSYNQYEQVTGEPLVPKQKEPFHNLKHETQDKHDQLSVYTPISQQQHQSNGASNAIVAGVGTVALQTFRGQNIGEVAASGAIAVADEVARQYGYPNAVSVMADPRAYMQLASYAYQGVKGGVGVTVDTIGDGVVAVVEGAKMAKSSVGFLVDVLIGGVKEAIELDKQKFRTEQAIIQQVMHEPELQNSFEQVFGKAPEFDIQFELEMEAKELKKKIEDERQYLLEAQIEQHRIEQETLRYLNAQDKENKRINELKNKLDEKYLSKEYIAWEKELLEQTKRVNQIKSDELTQEIMRFQQQQELLRQLQNQQQAPKIHAKDIVMGRGYGKEALLTRMLDLDSRDLSIIYRRLASTVSNRYHPEKTVYLIDPDQTRTYTGRLIASNSLAEYIKKLAVFFNFDSNLEYQFIQKMLGSYFSLAREYCRFTDNEHGVAQFSVYKSIIMPQSHYEHQLKEQIEKYQRPRVVYDVKQTIGERVVAKIDKFTTILDNTSMLQEFVERISHSGSRTKLSTLGHFYVNERQRNEYPLSKVGLKEIEDVKYIPRIKDRSFKRTYTPYTQEKFNYRIEQRSDEETGVNQEFEVKRLRLK